MGVESSAPPKSTGGWSWVQRALTEKADEKWVESEIKGVRDFLDDTKKIALKAKKVAESTHMCNKEEDIKQLKTFQYKLTSFKIPAIITVITFVIAAAGQYFTLKDAVEDGNQDQVVIQKTLKAIEQKQKDTSVVIEKMKTEDPRQDRKQNEELREMFREVLAEVRADIKPARRRDR